MSERLEIVEREESSNHWVREVYVHMRPSIIYRVLYYIMAGWLIFASISRVLIMFRTAQPLDALPFVGATFGALALLAAIFGLDKEG